MAAYRKKQAEDRTSMPGPSKSRTPSVQAKSVQQFSVSQPCADVISLNIMW